jgi:hypothetical protein
MVPIIPGIRSTPSNSSSNATSGNKKREATSSVGPVDDGSEADSMRPQAPEYYFRRNKRRRTVIDAFNSISLQKEDSDADADSSQAIAEEVEEEYYCNSSASSLEDVDDEEIDPLADETLLSDTEVSRNAAERKVMLELVFGPEDRDPVDRKLHQLVKKSLDRVAAGELPIETKDDMSLNTIYNSTCDSDITFPRDSVYELKRSNSLPEMMSSESLNERMEMD